MDQATADRIAAALEAIAGELAGLRQLVADPKFIPTGFAVVTPEEMRKQQLAAALGGIPPGTLPLRP